MKVTNGCAAGAALALLLLTGCSGSTGDAGSVTGSATGSPSEAATASASAADSAAATPTPGDTTAAASGTPVVTAAQSSVAAIGPIVVEPTQTDVAATVGRYLDFNVGPDPGNWTLSSDNEAIVGELSQGGRRDGALFNPGAKALAVGSATVTLENSEGLEPLVFKIQVTQ